MERKNLSDLVSEMQNINPDSREGTAQFVRTFFDTLTSGLQSDGFVKVKGFGTFRIVDISPRESVDVSSGRRIEIKGHSKITFVPDASLRDAVNEPFAHLQSVAINEETDLQQMSLSDDAEVAALLGVEVAPASAVPQAVLTPNADTVERSDEVPTPDGLLAQDKGAGPEAAQDNNVELVPDAVPLEEADEEAETDESAETAVETDSESSDDGETDAEIAEESEPDKDELASEDEPGPSKSKRGLILAIIICVVVAALAFAAGYYAGMKDIFMAKKPAAAEQSAKSVVVAAPSQKKAAEEAVKPSVPAARGRKQEMQSSKPAPKLEPKKPVMPVQQGDAYAIVGQRGMHVLARGENISRIAKAIYGSKDCAKYIIRYNGISNPDHIEIGQTLKLPELAPLNK